MTDKLKNTLKYLVRIIVVAVLLGWVFRRIDMQQLAEMAKSAQWEFLGALWIFVIILLLAHSLKTKLIMAKQGCHVSVGRLFSLSAITALYGMFIPGILSTGVKWYILKKITGKGTNVLSAMVYNQLSIIVIMTVLGLAALIIDNPTTLLFPDAKNTWLIPAVCSVLLAATIITSLLLLNKRSGAKVIKGLNYILTPFPTKIRNKARKIFQQIAVFQEVGYGFHTIVALITVIANIGGAVAVYVLSAKAANIDVPVRTLVWLTAIIFILGRLPISIANLGIREVTLVGLLPLYGAESSAAMLMSMVVFSATICRATLGAICHLFWATSEKKASPP